MWIDLIVSGRSIRCVVVIRKFSPAIFTVSRLHRPIEHLGFASIVDRATILCPATAKNLAKKVASDFRSEEDE